MLQVYTAEQRPLQESADGDKHAFLPTTATGGPTQQGACTAESRSEHTMVVHHLYKFHLMAHRGCALHARSLARRPWAGEQLESRETRQVRLYSTLYVLYRAGGQRHATGLRPAVPVRSARRGRHAPTGRSGWSGSGGLGRPGRPGRRGRGGYMVRCCACVYRWGECAVASEARVRLEV